MDLVKLENYNYPWELEEAIAQWVGHRNHERYHESLDNVTPAYVYTGRRNDILDKYRRPPSSAGEAFTV